MAGQIWAILLAAGQGSRLSEALHGYPKQFLQWRGLPLYWHSALTLAHAGVDGLVVVVAEEYFAAISAEAQTLARAANLGIPLLLARGGKERQDSVKNGLEMLPKACDRVLVHDAARPFVSARLVRAVIDSLNGASQAVIPGIPVTDTIKLLADDPSGQVLEYTLPRARLRAAQTPQGFTASALREAHASNSGAAVASTDDAMLWEKLGGRVKIIPGESGNIKITVPADLRRLAMNDSNPIPCCGMGYDAHRFGAGRPLRLGGVPIPCEYEIIAHSDGDVLLHSLMDALLGMAALGDIGRHFPDSDPAYENISSSVLLDEVLEMLKKRGVTPTHIDMTVVAQKPRLTPFAENIRKNVARLVGLPLDAVNFKATTEEGLGFTGSLEGIKAYALATGLKCGTEYAASCQQR